MEGATFYVLADAGEDSSAPTELSISGIVATSYVVAPSGGGYSTAEELAAVLASSQNETSPRDLGSS